MPPTTKLKAAVVWVLVVVGAPVLVAAPADAKADRCTIVGTAGDDVLLGTARDDVICGLGGDDKIVGRGGNDVLRGGPGDDLLRGGPGDDWVAGGRGDDRSFGQGGDDIVRGDAGNDEIVGGPGNDRMGGFRGADELDGLDAARFTDTMRCGPGPDSAAGDPADEVKPDCETVLQNDPPTDITLAPSSISENEPVGSDIGDLTATDADAGDSHTFTLVPGAGSADNALVDIDGTSLESAAGYDFEVDPELSVRVRATDEAGESFEKAFTVTVTDANDAPVTSDDHATTLEDTTLDLPLTGAGSPAANDTDQDGDALAVSAVSNPTGGAVSISGGQIHFVPTADLCGADAGAFDYTVSDGNGGLDGGAVTIDITCADDNPTAVDDSGWVNEDAQDFVDPVANDVDPDGDPITITAVTQPAHGTATIFFAANDIQYVPNADYCNDPGPAPVDTFTYTVNGGDTATVSATVICLQDAPTAVDDERTTDEDTPFSDPVTGAGSPAANDIDVDGDTLTVTSVSDPTGGTVAIASGQITFTPTANLCGDDAGSYDYAMLDGNGFGDTGTVTIDITCANDAPVANDDSRTVAEDSAPTTFGTLLDNDTDVESDPITITGASDPANGTTSFTAGDVTYTPDVNYCGPDSFTYTVNGGDTATVSVTVTCVNDAPVANDNSKTVGEDDPATAIDVLGNDNDVEGDAITVSSASDPANGSVALTGPAGAETGLTYTPDANYCNAPPGTTPDTFTYTVNGGSTATVSVTVTCVDDSPVAVDDTASLIMNGGAASLPVLANDTDIDGGPKAISAASDPDHGTVVLTGGSAGEHTGLTYEPDNGYCNTEGADPDDTFTYTLTPGGDSAEVAVEVTCDVPPVAVDDAETVAEDDPATAIDVLANDTNPDGGPEVITAASDPANGSVVLTGPVGARDGLTYEPDPDYCNDPGAAPTDDFTYTLNGGDIGSVAVTVTCVDDNPTADDDAATVAEDSGATAIVVLANDDDVEGDPITIASASDPANGTVVLTGPVGARDGLTYSPDPDYCNDPPPFDTFTYTVNGGDTATVSVTVTCVPDAPTLDSSAGTTTYTEDAAPVAIDGNVTISNPDGLVITAGSVTLTDDVAGDVLDWSDNNLGDSITEGTSTALQVNLTGTGTAAQWEAALEAVTFATPSQNPSGADRTATFAVTTTAGSPSDTKLVDAANVDDPPTADPDAATVLEDSVATAVTVLANDDDVDGGLMTITSVSDPANGTTVITGGGTGLTYAPDPNYCNDPVAAADDTFTYTLNSGGSPQTATVSMTVTCVNDAPVADDETFNGNVDRAIGNTALVVNAPGDGAQDPVGPQKTTTGNILGGDTDVDGPNALGITPGTIPTNDGGSVLLEADGDFTFFPSPGVSCADTSDFFDYTVTDGNTPTAGTDTGRVTIEIAECVWYVDQAASAGGTGGSDAPLNALTSLNGAGGGGDLDGSDDYLFVYSGSTFTGGLPLETNQRLYGQPHGLFVDNVSLVSPAAGTNPNIYNSAVGNGITLANGVDIQRVDAGTAAAKGQIGVRGNGVTTATIGPNTQINSTSVGVALTGVASGNITIGSTIVAGEGNAVAVTDRSGGTVSFTGPVTGTGINSSVEIRNNTGATVSLTGKVSVSGNGSPGNPALWVAGGGTIVASNAANEILSFTQTGVSLDGVSVGAGGVVLGTVSSAGGGAVNGVLLNNLSGTGAVTVGGGTLTTSLRGVDVNGGSGDVTIGATLEPTGGRSVEVTNRTGGTVDLNGLVNEDATGINLTTNSTGTIRFDGGVVASTGTSTAFNATGGGTVVVTDPNALGTLPDNTLTTTTGSALNVVGTTIGGGNLNFRSISANGAANALLLSATGTSGRLIVTGNGGTCTAANTGGCSGGEIRNGTGADSSSATPAGTGIVLNDTLNPSFTRVWVHDHSNFGIRGTSVAGFTLANSVVNGTNGNNGLTPFDEASVRFENLTGSATVSDSHVSGGREDNLKVANSAGSLDRLTISNSTFGLTSTVEGNDSVSIGSGAGAGALKATIQNSTFTGTAGDLVDFNHNGTGLGDLVLNTNAFSNNHPAIATGGGGLTLTNNGTSGNTTMTIDNNTFRDAVGPGILVVKTLGTSVQTGSFTNNSIGVAGVPNSGSAEGSALKLQTVGQGSSSWTVTGNQVRGYNNFGIEVLAGGGAVASGGTINATITGNTVTAPGNTLGTITIPKQGVHFNIGTVPGDTFAACGAISANALATSGADGVPPTGVDVDVRLRQRQSTTIRLPGYAGSPTDTAAVQTFVAGNNPGGTAVLAAVNSPPGGGFTGGAPATCP